MRRIPLKTNITPEERKECEKILGTEGVPPVEFLKAMWQLGAADAQGTLKAMGCPLRSIWMEEEGANVFLVLDGERTDVAEIEMVH